MVAEEMVEVCGDVSSIHIHQTKALGFVISNCDISIGLNISSNCHSGT